MTEIIDKFGLTESELSVIKDSAENMTFDFIKYADELTIIVSTHKPSKGENFNADFDVLIKGMSEDEGGNGYFGYSSTRKLLSKEYLDDKLED